LNFRTEGVLSYDLEVPEVDDLLHVLIKVPFDALLETSPEKIQLLTPLQVRYRCQDDSWLTLCLLVEQELILRDLDPPGDPLAFALHDHIACYRASMLPHR